MILGLAPDGTKIEGIEIANGPARAVLMTYGATLCRFHVDGIDTSLALGSPEVESYFAQMRYFGAIVGPVANRIAGGVAPLDDDVLRLAVNENGNALHGGPNGLSQQVWTIASSDAQSVTFHHVVSDGADGLPGPIDMSVTYALVSEGALEIAITAKSDRATLFNPAFHGYWSLTGSGLDGHRLTIDADHYLPVDDALIPTGDIRPVEGTPFDLRRPTSLPATTDLDTNFCLNGDGFRPVATLETDAMAMIVETDAPGLQVYDAARLNTAPAKGHHGLPYGRHAGLAMEPQYWPDAPNHDGFPSITLRPGTPFRQFSRFRFIRKDLS
ncbi:galactose mutarotase [Marivita lacus]|uniref:Galactose mutarotase n=1 Tax=Marivita lacus TaxID=1323742 RepID=A0ABQ1LE47_9RHOB|nr:aldose epimerase family protein [Marivita lacus]GGC22368.1 galactose mutarotase [Marivita lacus]